MDNTFKATFLVKRDTTARWNSCPLMIPKKGQIIVYTDYSHKTDDEGNEVLIPGLKIGDGNAYLVDLPFVGEDKKQDLIHLIEEFEAHKTNNEIHVSEEDRRFWNNKLNYQINGETLVLTVE